MRIWGVSPAALNRDTVVIANKRNWIRGTAELIGSGSRGFARRNSRSAQRSPPRRWGCDA
jgi:hypothetical protein